jgi:hypothetical protein
MLEEHTQKSKKKKKRKSQSPPKYLELNHTSQMER